MSTRASARSGGRLGVAVIGAGRWGKNLIRVFGSLENARLVSVCDVDCSRLSSLDTGAKRVPDYSQILSDSRVDAVVIATPPSSHTELAVACFEAGKHVFVEKPMALSTADARRVVRAARLAHRRGMIGFVLHYHPAIEKLRHWIGSGELGEVQSILSSRRGSHAGTEDPGPWWSLGPHDVSLACFLLGRDPQSITLAHRVDGRATTVDARLEFLGGCTAEISLATGTHEKVRRLVVVGTRASAVFDDTLADHKLMLLDASFTLLKDLGNMASHLAGLRPVAVPQLPSLEPLRIEAAHFVDALLGDAAFRSDVVDGARVVEILEAGQVSVAHGGCPVSLGTRTREDVSLAGRPRANEAPHPGWREPHPAA